MISDSDHGSEEFSKPIRKKMLNTQSSFSDIINIKLENSEQNKQKLQSSLKVRDSIIGNSKDFNKTYS